MALREKTLSYRRAEWFRDIEHDLEKCLRQAHAQLKTIDDRTIARGGQQIKIAKEDGTSSTGLFIHLTTETPGESASVVPKATPGAIAVNLTTEKPPPDGEWLDGDAFLYVQANNVCMCTTEIRDQAIATFMRHLFTKAKLPKTYIDFDLMKAADISKIKLLHSQGVKELEIRGVLYKATADYERRKAHVTGGLGAVGKYLKEFLKKPYDVTPDSLRVTLTLKVDRRFSKGLSLGEKNIEEMAADVIEHSEADDDYVIVTKTGQKISPKEIFVRSSAMIDSDGKTVNRDKAWKELSNFHSQLALTGIFEQ